MTGSNQSSAARGDWALRGRVLLVFSEGGPGYPRAVGSAREAPNLFPHLLVARVRIDRRRERTHARREPLRQEEVTQDQLAQVTYRRMGA